MGERERVVRSRRLWVYACLTLLVIAAGLPAKAQVSPPFPFSPQSYPAGGYVVGMAVGDFNGDGHFDLVTANSNGTIGVLLGKGDGTFQKVVNYPALSHAQYVLVGDFTGNGHQDIVVASSYSGIGIFLGNGDGTFQPMMIVSTNFSNYNSPVCSSYPYSGLNGLIAAGDFNKDGKLDLVTCNETADGVDILLGNGDGTFQPPVSYVIGVPVATIAVGDFNGDGNLDVVTGNLATGPPAFANAISVLLGNGDGTFQPPVFYSAGGDFLPYGIMLGDFNGDGNLDLAGLGGHLDILLGDGKGGFELTPWETIYPSNFYDLFAQNGALGDFYANGALDAAVVSGQGGHYIFVMAGYGNANFQPASYYNELEAGGGAVQAIVSADFNGDGLPDLALAYSGSVGVLLNTGTGAGGGGGGGGGGGSGAGAGTVCYQSLSGNPFIAYGGTVTISSSSSSGSSSVSVNSVTDSPGSGNFWAPYACSSTTGGGTTGGGTVVTGGSGSTLSCDCNFTKAAPYVNPATVTPGKTVAPITAIGPDLGGTIPGPWSHDGIVHGGINDGVPVPGLIDVTTSSPNGIDSAQVAKVKGNIPTGDPVVNIKGFKSGSDIVYNAQYAVVNLIDQNHYQVQNLGAFASSKGGISTAVSNPLLSPNGKYTVTASIPLDPNTGQQLNYYSQIKVTLTSSPGTDVTPAAIQGNHVLITTHWAFSPDEDRLYIDSTDPTSPLASTCVENMSVYDLAKGILVASDAAAVFASRAQFSPSGEYLVYTRNEYFGGCYTPLSNSVDLEIFRIKGVTTQDKVYETPSGYLFTLGAVTNEDPQFGAVGNWGFSPDNPETSFVYAFVPNVQGTSPTLEWTLVNLAEQQHVAQSLPSVAAGAAWQFCPCGDIVGLVMPQGTTGTQLNVAFYNTSTGQEPKGSPQTFSSPSITLVTAAGGQGVQLSSGGVASVVAGSSCGKPNTPASSPPGSPVTVTPKDAAGSGKSPVTVTFASVTAAGETSVTLENSSTPPPPGPAGFELIGPPTYYYDVSTTAPYSLPVTVCINYAGIISNSSAIQLDHYQNGAWQNVTATVDTATTTVCGTVTVSPALSPFALFEPSGSTPVSIAATAGTPQTAAIGTAFAAPLQAKVTNSNGAASGVTVTFTAPAAVASGTFAGALTAVAATDASGVATAPPLTANGTAGSYVVTASVNGVATPASFSLSNTGLAPTLQSITLSAASLTLPVGGFEPFTATGNYSDGSTQNLTGTAAWTSSNPAAATISTGGVATAVAAGTTTIKAAASGVSGTATLATAIPAYRLAIAVAGPMTMDASGNYAITVNLTNKGNVTLEGMTIQKALLGTTAANALPASITNLVPGASAPVSFTFSPSAGAAGSTKVLRITGLYVGSLPGGATQSGGFNLALFAVLP